MNFVAFVGVDVGHRRRRRSEDDQQVAFEFKLRLRASRIRPADSHLELKNSRLSPRMSN